MTKQHKKDPIPEDVSREELAKFWDTHSIADYWDELKPANVKFSKNLKSVYKNVVVVKLDSRLSKAIEKVAKDKGVDTSTASNLLIKERLTELQIL